MRCCFAGDEQRVMDLARIKRRSTGSKNPSPGERRGQGRRGRCVTGEKASESVGDGWEAVAVASPRDAPRRRLPSGRLDRIRTSEGPSPFRAEEGVKRPGLNHFHFGPHLTEQPFLVQPGFEPGHADPGGSGRDPDRSGPKRTRPK